MGFGGSGGGSSSIASSTDAAVSNPALGEVLTYNSVGKWQNLPAAVATVSSVAGKTGAVTLTESDVANLTTDLAAKALNSAVVHTSGAETIAGAKTFTSTIVGSISGVAANVTTNANLTGDVTSSGNATTITANAVTNTKAAQMAANTFKANNTGATANASDVTVTQATAMLNGFMGDSGSGGTKGLVPAPATGDAAKYLRGDGTWGVVAGGGTVTSVSVTAANGVSGAVATATSTPAITLTLGAITPSSVAATGTVTGSNLSGTNTGNQTITLTSDVTGTGTGSFATTITANAVTNAKAAQMPANTLKGNNSGATANAADLTSAQVKTMLAIAESDVTNLTADLAAKATAASLATVATSGSYADLSNKPSFVDLTTAQSVGGVKTFTSIPVVPATTPTTATQVASKGYVDANVGSTVGSATPLALGSASAGVSTSAARQDHVHPTTGLMLTTQQTSLKAVNIYVTSAYPARPSGYGSVEWIGPVDPGASAFSNDTWINTA